MILWAPYAGLKILTSMIELNEFLSKQNGHEEVRGMLYIKWNRNSWNNQLGKKTHQICLVSV